MAILIPSMSALLLAGCLANPKIGRDSHLRVVFIGDSITARWDLSGYFGKDYINKGIEGQTAEQIAARFQNDVIDLKPDAVVILAGTNDVRAESDLALAHDSIAAMVQLARANGIRPVVCTIPPTADHLDSVRRYNLMLTNDPALQVSCDYYRALTDANGTPIAGALSDGIHPSILGYVRMAAEINQVLNSQAAKLSRLHALTTKTFLITCQPNGSPISSRFDQAMNDLLFSRSAASPVSS